jgi:signal transduction histidine kinase
MKDFSHPGSTEKELVDINHGIESTVTVARNEWKYVADVHLQLDPDLPSVPCLASEFNQVILNLLINAAHAIQDTLNDGGSKGTITVSTAQAGEWAEIRVSDSGTGIPPQIAQRIFEPFFTTKEVGRGTGQGLAIARSVIVEKHGGTIDFETEVGRGTTFIIRLPLNEATARQV